MKKLPKHWYLLGEKYDVVLTSEVLHDESGGQADALLEPEQHRISIRNTCGTEFHWKALFHESIHFTWANLIRPVFTPVIHQSLAEGNDNAFEEVVSEYFSQALFLIFYENGFLQGQRSS